MSPKVCILTTAHPAFDIRIFHKEAKTLAGARFDVILIAQHDKTEIVDGIKIIPLPKTTNRIYRIFKTSLIAFWIALKQKASVYHFHDPELLPVGVLLKLLKRTKVIYDVHEDYGKQMLSKLYIPRIMRKGVGFLVRTVESFCSKLFDAIIAATDDILEKFSFHKRAVTVRNFPILANFCVEGQKRKIESKVFSLIYVGGLNEIRGITQIVRALDFINSNNQLKLTLCGDFYPSDYEHKLRSLKGFKKVEYLGWVKPYKIPNLLGRHDAGIVCFLPEPNHINAMPNKIFEYMAAGLPIIASNFPLWKEIVEGNGCGICVNPLNPEEIAGGIEYLMQHPSLREEMGENGRRAVVEKYNWEMEGKKLVDLYDQLFAKEKSEAVTLLNSINTEKDLPFISVIVPCRNEEKFIDKCLDSIIANDFPKNKLEVLVVDGISEDRTREVVKGYTEKYLFIRLLDNPKKITPSSFNMGVKNAKGEIIIIMSSHATFEKEYISKCVKYLREYDADNVGGICITLPGSNTLVAHSIALVLSHPFGVGNAYFRIGLKEPKSVDTVPFGCYKREVFENMGLFDEDLLRNQDDEFNLRLLKNGGKILLFPDIVSYYYSRERISKLWKMYFQYGYFKPLVIQKVGGIMTWRQIIPSILVGSLFITGLFSFFIRYSLWGFFLILGSYIGINLVFSLILSIKEDFKLFPLIAISFATLHVGYGAGYIKGIFDFMISKRHLKRRMEDVKLTR
jgi:glycosyltransferase involved in cell wall biosynthesis